MKQVDPWELGVGYNWEMLCAEACSIQCKRTICGYRSKGTTEKYRTSHKNTSPGMVFSSPQDLYRDE